MADLEKVIKGLKSCLREDIGDYKCEGCPYLKEPICFKEVKRDALNLLKKQKRKTGHWVDNCSCSECAWTNDGDDGFARIATHFNYCPNCGAIMDGR